MRGIDLEIPEGEIVVMLDPSGSGKSTLLNINGGLVRPTAGRVRFRDVALSAISDRELTRFRRDNVGFVCQFHEFVPSLHRAGERRAHH